jgi:putative ATP-dependent endonuclease of OLD family
VPDRDIPPDAAKALVGERLTEGEWEAAAKTAHLANLRKDEGGSVTAFPSEQWTLEFDLARKPELAIEVHTAICLARGTAGRTRQQIVADALAELNRWRALPNQTADDIAVRIFEPLYKNRVSKAEVAEQLASLIDGLADDTATFRGKLPGYIVNAIDHATGA